MTAPSNGDIGVRLIDEDGDNRPDRIRIKVDIHVKTIKWLLMVFAATIASIVAVLSGDVLI